MKNFGDKILIFLKGLLMGMCDVVPGVSGGTIAVITGIYERLINAIKNVLPSLKLFFKGNFKEFWKQVDGTFLLCLICGIGAGIIGLANLITLAMDNYPILIWSFFVGLILISTIFLGKQVKRNRKTVLAFLIFGIAAYFITSPENEPIANVDSNRYIFVCGMIAICAMILPGISGSFMLVMLGKYEYILNSLKNLDLVVILLFILGAVIGIVLFSNILSRLFKSYKMLTLAALTGFMLGSLNKIWPWKESLVLECIDKCDVAKNVLPRNYAGNNQLVGAIICMIIGIVVVLLIEYIGAKMGKSEKKK